MRGNRGSSSSKDRFIFSPIHRDTLQVYLVPGRKRLDREADYSSPSNMWERDLRNTATYKKNVPVNRITVHNTQLFLCPPLVSHNSSVTKELSGFWYFLWRFASSRLTRLHDMVPRQRDPFTFAFLIAEEEEGVLHK